MDTPGKAMPEDQAETLAGHGAPVVAVRTPDNDDGPFGDLDTARLRNVIARRVFGETIDPVRIGRYPTLRRIGQGGMGVVYAAYDNELDRRIAIKLLWRGDVQDEAEAARMRARMLREARALAQLSDPSIVQIYEAGEHEGHVFLAMEFVEGPTLRQWLESERRSVTDVLEVFAQAGRGLAAAHAAGLVHRDFKPENVVITPQGVPKTYRVRVLDFGVALTTRAVQEPELVDAPAANDDARLTMTGAMIGTPAYMAPEQIDRSRAADARSDQFSFAVALFEALFGRRPFVGGSITEVVAATLAGRIDIPAGR
ncbi:MAG TPA: serine/threonine-protein kinase, partial [Nannocystaceae bacterium]|nr:serine/threonine-protein kinase [Nannocystaceae bacterium]